MNLAQNVALLPISREGMGCLNLVLTWDNTHLVLIDTGVPGQTEDIVKAIENQGLRAENLTHIILTHQDWDHTGCTNDLLKLAPNAKVVAHADEAPYIDGRVMPIKLASRLAEYDSLAPQFQAGVDRWKETYQNSPIYVHEQVTDKQVLNICGGIEIVHVPGHTPGHIAVYLKQSRIIVCGDAANVREGQLVGSTPRHTFNQQQADESLQKIKKYDYAWVVTYHTGFLKQE